MIPVLPVTDTVKRVDSSGRVVATVDRAELRAVQTPQGFSRAVLLAAHRAAEQRSLTEVTDDAGLLEALGVAGADGRRRRDLFQDHHTVRPAAGASDRARAGPRWQAVAVLSDPAVA